VPSEYNESSRYNPDKGDKRVEGEFNGALVFRASNIFQRGHEYVNQTERRSYDVAANKVPFPRTNLCHFAFGGGIQMQIEVHRGSARPKKL
ncbi:hypothetical protein K0M31_007845, partial [Melipona bicolor]